MAALIQFVDSISDNPTVRLDVNDGVTWFCQSFKAPPPRLRKSVASNAMRDGEYVSSSSYEGRVLEIELTLIKEDRMEEWAAIEMQKLWRELDRPNNWIKYQSSYLEKPVFFRTSRSDVSDLEELWTEPIARSITLELAAEPAALGLPETLGPYTVTNDPAAASNGCFFDVTGVIGDLAAPVMVHDATRVAGHGILATRTRGPLADLVWNKQFEAGTNIVLGTDTTNPGGGPDAAMSGTGVNNYVRTSFATNAAMVDRVQWQMFSEVNTANRRLATTGVYRVIVILRRSDSTSNITVRRGPNGETATTAATTSRQMVDLGILSIGQRAGSMVGYSGTATSYSANLPIQAQRVSGTGTLDWDAVVLVPADERQVQWTINSDIGTGFHTLLDGIRESVGVLSATTGPLSATPGFWPLPQISVSGGLPSLSPNVTNRFFFLQAASKGGAMTKADTSAISLYYWPRYLFVRPVST